MPDHAFCPLAVPGIKGILCFISKNDPNPGLARFE